MDSPDTILAAPWSFVSLAARVTDSVWTSVETALQSGNVLPVHFDLSSMPSHHFELATCDGPVSTALSPAKRHGQNVISHCQ